MVIRGGVGRRDCRRDRGSLMHISRLKYAAKKRKQATAGFGLKRRLCIHVKVAGAVRIALEMHTRKRVVEFECRDGARNLLEKWLSYSCTGTTSCNNSELVQPQQVQYLYNHRNMKPPMPDSVVHTLQYICRQRCTRQAIFKQF